MKHFFRFKLFCLATTATLLGLTPMQGMAQDKSASSVIQLPGAGGTVNKEEGAFGLNMNTGSANFSLPFPELPTRGKHSPSISLNYSQFAGDNGSGMGIGWDINVPSIAMNDDLGTAIGGFKSDGDFFSRISMSGQRLVFVGKTQDGAGLKYRPEYSEDFIQITYRAAGFSVAVLGPHGEGQTVAIPSGFEVLRPDGMRQYFSGDPAVAEGKFEAAAPYATRWPLVLEVNPDRDAIAYEYVKHGNRAYLAKIAFAGGRSAYSFDLLDTQANLVSNATGARQVNSKLYGRVTASFDGDVYNRWCLGYIGRSGGVDDAFTVRAHPDCLAQAQADLTPLIDAKSVTVLDQLRMIYRFGDNGDRALSADTQSLPSIALGYSSWTTSDLASRNVVYEAPKLAFAGDLPPLNFELADMNMDALVDIVQSTPDQARVLLGEGSLDSSFSQSSNLVLSRTGNSGMRTDVIPRLADDRFQFADIYGDSYTDIVEIGDDVIYIYAGDSAGNFTYIGREIQVPGISPALFSNGRSRFLDVNMDDQSDIVSTRLNADGQTEWQIFLNLTRRQPDGEHRIAFGALQKKFPFAVQDASVLAARDVRVTDINGDRLPDLVTIRPAQQGFCIYENRGTIFSRDPATLLFGDASKNDPVCGTGSFTRVSGMQPNDRLETMWYVDANGDGIMDFANMGGQTDQFRVWLGFGDGTFLTNPLNIALNLRVQVGSSTASFRSRVVDLDADGQSEILVFQQPAGDDVKPVVVIDFNRSGETQLTKANLLTTVEFGSGRRHDVRYATSTDELLRDKANGHPFTKLHFPVVVAKQLVTSEGVPGLPRNLVQTEEYFYHRPFFDVINNRFIGFSEVEKVVYGDEFVASGETTQRSAYTNEQYYTFAETAVNLHLTGKLKVSKTYTVAPEPQLVASAAETSQFDPSLPFQHSLSTATRGQKLPVPGVLLKCQSAVWEAVASADGSSYLRKTSESFTAAAGVGQQQPASDESCADPVKVETSSRFDEFNQPGEIATRVRDIAGANGLTVPGFVSLVRNDFTESRQALAAIGVVNAVSERTTLAGTRPMSIERFRYAAATGRLTGRELDVFSSLENPPAALAGFHQPKRTMTKKFDFDVFGNTVGVSDVIGAIEKVTFDPTGVLPIEHRKVNGSDPALDQVTTLAYDGPRAGLVSRQTTPLGAVVTYEHDSLSRKISEKAQDGAERIFRYKIGQNSRPSLIMTSHRRYASVADVPAGESEFIDLMSAYNADGNEIAKIENVAEGGIRVFAFKQYNRNRKLIFEWTPFSLASFEGVANLDVRKTFELGAVPQPVNRVGTNYGYDELGRVIMEADPAGKVSTSVYQDWGKDTTTRYKEADGRETTQRLLAIGNERGIFAQIIGNGADAGHTTQYKRDAFGYLAEILLPGEKTPRSYVYNSAGDLEAQTVPGMGRYFYLYDTRGRQTVNARSPESGGSMDIVETGYDLLNRRVSETVNGKQTIAFRYDVGQPMVVAAAFGQPIDRPLAEPVEIRTFDPNGLFDAVQRFGYDRNGRLVHSEIDLAGKTYAESYSLTLDGRITRSTDPGKLTSMFGLGPDSNLISVTISHPNLAAPEPIISKVLYSPEGRIKRLDYRRNAFTDMVYNPNTLYLEAIRTQVTVDGAAMQLQDLEMVFNGNGSINKITDRATSRAGHVDRSGEFDYDFKNQLVRYKRYGEEALFDYAPSGSFSRNDEFEAGAAIAPAADAVTGLIPVGTAARPYAFDGFGQLTTSPSLVSTSFDPHGRLIRATTAQNEVAYGYDHSGRRIYQRISSRQNPAEAMLYLYPMQSFSVGPKGEESFVFVGDSRLVRMEHATGKWFYYLKDHLSSSDFVMNEDGVPVEQMLYRAFGTEHAPEALSPAWAAQTAANVGLLPAEKTHHRFTGQYLDDATGLYYYGQRYYDPKLGRFVSPDPLYLGDPKKCETNQIGCNLFAYANNNPMAFIDPTGLDGVVAGDAAFRKEVEKNLQKLDPSARVDAKTGEITQNWLVKTIFEAIGKVDPSAGHNQGRELVSQIIDSKQTTTIEKFSGDTATTWDPAKSPATTAVDATIRFNPSFDPKVNEFDPSTKTVSLVKMSTEVVLGHELIHATRVMTGSVDFGMVNYKGLDGSAQSWIREEVRTVGVGGVGAANDITENNLREMLGRNPRNHYD
jgi:RHS repeat-associated protein